MTPQEACDKAYDNYVRRQRRWADTYGLQYLHVSKGVWNSGWHAGHRFNADDPLRAVSTLVRRMKTMSYIEREQLHGLLDGLTECLLTTPSPENDRHQDGCEKALREIFTM